MRIWGTFKMAVYYFCLALWKNLYVITECLQVLIKICDHLLSYSILNCAFL